MMHESEYAMAERLQATRPTWRHESMACATRLRAGSHEEKSDSTAPLNSTPTSSIAFSNCYQFTSSYTGSSAILSHHWPIQWSTALERLSSVGWFQRGFRWLTRALRCVLISYLEKLYMRGE